MSVKKPGLCSGHATRLGLTAAASVLAIVIATPVAFAQDAAPANDEVVVVTGQRSAARSAQDIKKRNALIVDSIVSEDVGKLPDNNVADALARVPGIQVRRDSGEANSVLIRGLPNVVTLLNGREMFTTTGRFVALADIPANMVQRVDVFKSNGPDQIEGGIAGTIDVRLRRPFDAKGMQLNASGRVSYNDKSGKYDPNVGATISNRWDTSNGEFGALGGISYVRSHAHEERAFNVEFVDQTGFFGPCGPPACTTARTTSLPSGVTSIKAPFVMGYIPIKSDRERTSANIALQWRPNADTELYFDGFATEYRNNFELDFFVGLPLLGNGNISATVYPGTNILKTLTNHDVFTITSTQANKQKSFTTQFAVGGSHRVGDLLFSTDLSVTDSTFDYENPILDVSVVVPLVNVDTNADGTAQLNYGGPGFDIKSGNGFKLENWFDNYGHDKGSSIDWRGDMVWTPNDPALREVSMGVRFADRKASHINNFIGGSGPPPGAAIMANSISGLGGLSDPMADGGPDYVMTQWYTPSADFLLNNTGVIRKAFTGTEAAKPLDPGSYFSDNEQTAAIYVQAKIGGDLGSVPWSAVLGGRIVNTKEELKGNLAQDTNPANPGLEYTPIDRNSNDTTFLPSANIKFEIRPDLIGRLTAGKTLTRPNFADMNPGVSLSTVVSNTTGLTGGGGNPNLKPYTSDNFDASLEWYFEADGFLTVTAFSRKFKGYIQPYFGTETFGGLQYRVTRPENTGDGGIDGIEIGYQQFYDFLPGILSGFGLQANYTYMTGDTTAFSSVQNKFIQRPIAGLSEHTYNIALLYEKGPWSGRLAYNWRDKFQDTREFTPTYDLWVDTTAQMDGQLSYRVNDQLVLTLEGVNLLDTHFKDYFVDPLNPQLTGFFPRDTRRYDRTILFGARFKM